MTPEQEAAYVNAQSTAAMIEAMGMFAVNQKLLQVGDPPRYLFEDFTMLINQYGIHHNATISLFHDLELG